MASPSKPRILLADDTNDSQFVVAKLLERHGYEVTVVSDGHEAIAAWQKEPFDAILMDVQMPGLDGFRTTEAIRDRERESGRPAIPVVALTGHTGEEDRQRCLSAGMTTHLPKPIQPQRLLAMLEGLLNPDSGPPESRPRAADTFELGAESLLGQMEGDADLVRKLIGFFQRDRPVLMGQIRKAIDDNDAPSLAFAAHRLSGLVRNFGAAGAARSALTLESLARDEDLAGAAAVFQELSPEIDRLSAKLQAIDAEL